MMYREQLFISYIKTCFLNALYLLLLFSQASSNDILIFTKTNSFLDPDCCLFQSQKNNSILYLYKILFSRLRKKNLNKFISLDRRLYIRVNHTRKAKKENAFINRIFCDGFISGIMEFFADIFVRLGCWKCAKTLHNLLLHNIFRLPLAFMDVTPSGRILSRFSKDIDVLDNSLPGEISDLIYCLGDVCVIFSY